MNLSHEWSTNDQLKNCYKQPSLFDGSEDDPDSVGDLVWSEFRIFIAAFALYCKSSRCLLLKAQLEAIATREGLMGK